MRPALVVTTCALALASSTALAACGGDSRPYDQVPTSTPALVPPDDANDVAAGGSTTGTTTTDTTTTDTTGTTGTGTGGTGTGGTAAPSTGGTGTGTGGTGTGGTGTGGTGGTTGGGTTGGGTTGGGAAPNTGGASPDQNAGAGSFQKFCSDNPGAC